MWRWQAKSYGVWILGHCLFFARVNISHIIVRMLLGLQMLAVFGKSYEMPPFPEVYQSAHLSPCQVDVMGNVNNTQFIPYFITNYLTEHTCENMRGRRR